MIDFELKLPAAKKKTRNQIARDWMIDSAKRGSSSGYYENFKKRILEARKKDEAVNKAKKKISALEWVDANVAIYENSATPKQKDTLHKLQKRLATKPTEENLYDTYLQMIKSGELKPMSFEDFEKNFSGLDVQVKKRRKPEGQFEKIVSNLHKKKEPASPVLTAGLWQNIKNSSIYKLLENEKLLGTELGHESLIELIHLAQNAGLLKRGGRVK